MRRTLIIGFATVAAAGLATLYACNNTGGGGGGGDGGGNIPIRAEAACAIEGLPAPLRQTLILVDAKALAKATDGASFAKENTAFRDLVLSIADPARAIPAGTSAARERVVIAVVPSDGSSAQVTFTGCIPGMSDAELTAAQAEEGTMAKILTSGVPRQLEDQAEQFRLQLIGGMVAAAGRADGTPTAQTGAVDASPFLAGVRASKGLFENDDIAQRLILVSDLTGLALPAGDPAAQRKAAHELGRKAGGNLARADVHVVLPAGRSGAARAFFEGYFLAQDGRLASFDAGKVSGTSNAPTRLWHFAGEAAYPSGPELVDVRIGEDGRGKLTASWLTTLGDPHFPIPLTGQIVCTGDRACKIASDKGGFAQAWSDAPGDPPEFRNDLPFGGMRNFAFDIDGAKLGGRVFDNGVYVGTDTARNSIAITADAK